MKVIHTPGPWDVTFQPGQSPWISNPEIVIVHAVGPARSESEARANALVLAAAPELLDFAIQYLYSVHGICDPEHYACPYQPEELKDMAKALIAKTTGEV